MGDIRNHTTPGALAWLAEQAIPSGTEHIEVWGIDSEATPTAHSAIWFRLTDQTGETAPRLISAGQTYDRDLSRGGASDWTYSVRAVAGTPDAIVILD